MFAVSCHFTLDVLYNGSGYKLFSQSALSWLGEMKRNYKKSILTKFKNKLLNTDICSAS